MKKAQLIKMRVFRVSSGIILINPLLSLSSMKLPFEAIDTGATILDFMQMPISFWIVNLEGATTLINLEGMNVCGFLSEKHAIGHSLLKVSLKENAIQLLENCHQVIRTNQCQIFEELNIRKDGIRQQFLSIKLPWYDLDQCIIGVCGFSIVLGKHALAKNLSILAGYGIPGNIQPSSVNQYSTLDHFKNLSLPPREQQCLQFTLRGYTAKMIARELGLSYRTIESYLTNLKNRLGVSTRIELIQIAENHL